LLIEDDNDPTLGLLAAEDEIDDGDETLDMVLLKELCPLLLDGEESCNDLEPDFLTESNLLPLCFGDDCELKDVFFITGTGGFKLAEGKDACLPPGLFLVGSIVGVVFFLLSEPMPPSRFCVATVCFSSTSPVLFLLFDIDMLELIVGLDILDVNLSESGVLMPSTFFLADKSGAAASTDCFEAMPVCFFFT